MKEKAGYICLNHNPHDVVNLVIYIQQTSNKYWSNTTEGFWILLQIIFAEKTFYILSEWQGTTVIG